MHFSFEVVHVVMRGLDLSHVQLLYSVMPVSLPPPIPSLPLRFSIVSTVFTVAEVSKKDKQDWSFGLKCTLAVSMNKLELHFL